MFFFSFDPLFEICKCKIYSKIYIPLKWYKRWRCLFTIVSFLNQTSGVLYLFNQLFFSAIVINMSGPDASAYMPAVSFFLFYLPPLLISTTIFSLNKRRKLPKVMLIPMVKRSLTTTSKNNTACPAKRRSEPLKWLCSSMADVSMVPF